MTEEWKDTYVFGDIYQVSNLGNIRSKNRHVTAPRNRKRLIQGRNLNPYNTANGYKMIALSKQGIKKYIFVHRLVAFAFIDNPESKPFCNHIDGKKTNNIVSNIEWCTKSENGLHAWKTGLQKRRSYKGENSPRTKLKESDVINIRLRGAKGDKHTDIAADYGLKRGAIYNIINRKSWTHI